MDDHIDMNGLWMWVCTLVTVILIWADVGYVDYWLEWFIRLGILLGIVGAWVFYKTSSMGSK